MTSLFDNKIATHFNDILSFWFGGDINENYNKKWFPSSTSGKQKETDNFILNKFGNLIIKAENEELNDWKNNHLSYLSLIILLDQFSRHIYRDNIEKIKENDLKALEYADNIIKNNWYNKYNIPEFIFLLMPLRHQATSERLETVITLIDNRLQLKDNSITLLEKFKKTTQRRLQDIQGIEIWKDGDNILEFEEFIADESDIHKQKLYQSIKEFLIEQNASNYEYLAISLSGGVDSMVLTKFIYHMRNDFGGYKLITIHIDYGNRPESEAEANFVENWSKKLGCIFYKRKINEVTRGITKRDIYEKVSREIRYKTYSDILEKYKGKCPAIMFGHHKGDVQENIISNIMKGCSLLDLSGMGPKGIVNNVPIWRPMLFHDKKDIYSASHKYGIPYFLDSTPKWSTRGKMRNQLMPLLSEIYGNGFLDHLSHLANDSEELNSITSKYIINPFLKTVNQTNICVWFNCTNYMDQPLLFWKEVLTYICHNYLSIGLIREKAIKEILMRRFKQFSYSNPNSSFLALKKDNKCFMFNTFLIIFKTQMFPKQSYFQIGYDIIPNKKYSFGPWNIFCEYENKELLSDKITPRIDFFELLSGSFSYYIPISDKYIINPKDKNIPVKAANKHIKWAIPFVSSVKINKETTNDNKKQLLKVTITSNME